MGRGFTGSSHGGANVCIAADDVECQTKGTKNHECFVQPNVGDRVRDERNVREVEKVENSGVPKGWACKNRVSKKLNQKEIPGMYQRVP